MPTVAAVAEFLEQVAPFRLAEDWDNVGLLVGRRGGPVRRLMTCLTVTPPSAAEAIERHADLIVSHHPMPFRAARRWTDDTTVGRMLLDLAAAGVAVYSPHTAFDSAAEGVNARLAAGLGLCEIRPLTPHPEGEGTGRVGELSEPISLEALAERLKRFLAIERLQWVGDPSQTVHCAAVGCGAADELLDAAVAAHCDAMVLGEARFHTCLEAEAAGVGLLLPGHFASERFAVECLADTLARRFSEIETWASRSERDPLKWK
ncbi:MAG: Nif3-like dinuclear metal center hexameric protein [Planctomycetaceae bacterium]|nr:Nif3-like dinuclear metal center hexameric protein [Planctomycetaceae bacterium]